MNWVYNINIFSLKKKERKKKDIKRVEFLRILNYEKKKRKIECEGLTKSTDRVVNSPFSRAFD